MKRKRRNSNPLIYLDYQATTPVDPRVLSAMAPFWRHLYGNAASRSHAFGERVGQAVEKARSEIARTLGAQPEEIIFTSGATESNNLALKGAADIYQDRGRHIVSCVTEHKSVLDPLRELSERGFEVTLLGVGSDGLLDLKSLEESLRPDTILISVMTANNELGVLQPIADIGRIAKQLRIPFHTDATQAIGKVPFDVEALSVDMVSFSGHKLYGPKGVGALYIRSRKPHVRVKAQMHGGGHERDLRSGTLNTPGIVGLAKACVLAQKLLLTESKRIGRLRDRLKEGLLRGIPDAQINGSMTRRVPHNLNMSFESVEAESLIKRLKGIAVSSGSACSSANFEVSHVIRALGFGESRSHTSVRFSLGRFTTKREIDTTIKRVVEAVRSLRALSPLYRSSEEFSS